jgi:cAMP-dependent protein kinase regulator
VRVEEKLGLLRQFDRFKDVDEASLRQLVERAEEFTFPQGHTIAREGQLGTGLFVILQGTVTVVRHGVPIDTSLPGEIVGEMSIVARAPRVATLIAAEPVVCLGLASWQVAELSMDPALGRAMRDIDQQHRQAEAARRASERPLPRTSEEHG